MRKLIIILSIFITSSSEAITLKDAVETALSKNHELRAKALELEEKKKEIQKEINQLTSLREALKRETTNIAGAKIEASP